MSVRDYYLEHFDEMTLEKQKHFATRMKYWFGDMQFNDFLAVNEPSHDLAAVLKNNDFSGVNNLEQRRPFFEKYEGLYGLEACLFRLNRLLIEYNVDLREEFLQLFPREKLYKLCDELVVDDEALVALSTYAVNVICLAERLFPRDGTILVALARRFLHMKQTPELVYAYTHYILCMSNFYTERILGEKWELAKRMLAESERLILDNFDNMTIDTKLEFLVCCRINHNDDYYEPRLVLEKIRSECADSLKDSLFVIDSRAPSKNTLGTAEHRNVLYIMSGLDSTTIN